MAEDIFGGLRKLSELLVISKVNNTKAFRKLTWLRRLENTLLHDKLRVLALGGLNLDLVHRRFLSFNVLQIATVGCYRVIAFCVGQWRDDVKSKR